MRQRFATLSTVAVVAVWLPVHAVVTAEQQPGPATAIAQLVVPPLLWLALLQIGSAAAHAVRLAVRRPTSQSSTMDPPARLLAAAVAALPARRRGWGRAMLAELAEVRGRAARWRFARSCARATLWLPPAGGWPVLALVATVAGAAVWAAGPAVGLAAPGLTVFAATFTGLVAALVVLAVARSYRPRWPAPVLVPTVLVAAAVAAAIVATVLFLRRDPAAARHLPPPAAMYLAAGLVGCLWVAVAPPRRLGTDRFAAYGGAAGAVVFAAWTLLLHRLEPARPALPLAVLLVLTPFAAFVVPAFAAGRGGRSVRSGLRAAAWTVTAAMPLTYAVWLPEALRRHAIDGRTLDGELVGPIGLNLEGAVLFAFGIFPVFGLAFGLTGAALGARLAARNRLAGVP
jgi:hypothetical protein